MCVRIQVKHLFAVAVVCEPGRQTKKLSLFAPSVKTQKLQRVQFTVVSLAKTSQNGFCSGENFTSAAARCGSVECEQC